MLHMIFLILISLSFSKVFVVERETGRLAVIEKDRLKKEIKNLGNLNHATLKFKWGYGFLISRDGVLSKIDPEKEKLIKKVKVGSSSIGINFCKDKVLIANYEPNDVVMLSKDLKVLKRIYTDSRNVGIKSNGKVFVFALMDKDKVQVRKCKDGSLIKEIYAGKMPFDALLYGDIYVVGFFKEKSIGVLNLKNFKYKKVNFKGKEREVVFKIPHFGFWGIKNQIAYIPAVGERKIHVVDLKSFKYIKSIPLKGLPVFVAVSNNGRYLAVNYSGDYEDYLTVIDLKNGKSWTKKVGKRILHFRFTKDDRYIYASSYYENKVKKLSVPELKVLKEISVPTPSGVFIYGGD